MQALGIIKSSDFLLSFLKGSIPTALLLIVFIVLGLTSYESYLQSQKAMMPSVTMSVNSAGHSSNTIENVSKEHTTEAHHDKAHHHKTHVANIKLYKEGLIEETDFGFLPIINPQTNQRPFDAYKRPFISPLGQNNLKLALRIPSLTPEISQEIISKFPADISILTSPYSANLNQSLSVLKNRGQEYWLEFPIEQKANAKRDTGALALRNDLTIEENMSQYKRVMAKTAGYAGLFLTNIEGTALSLSSIRMEKLFGDLFERGLGLAYQSEEVVSVGLNTAELPVFQIKTEVIEAPFSVIQPDLDALLDKNQDTSLILTYYPNDIQLLEKWLETLPQKGYVLTPLSAKVE